MKEFQEISFKHIPRYGNYIAHSLASECLKKGVEVYKVNVALAFVQMVVIDESVGEPD